MPTETTAGDAVREETPATLELGQEGRASRVRWVILALIFFAITINYIDRVVLSILAPDLKKQFKIDDQMYGNIGLAFTLCYAIGQSISGRWLDWVGTRAGYV